MRVAAVPVHRSLPISLVALAAFAPASVLAGGPGLLGGHGTAATFVVYGSGAEVEGGAYDWTFACVDCLIRITFTEPTLVQVENEATTLAPGPYELRQFDGVFAERYEAPHEYDVLVWGAGKVNRLE